VPTEPDECCIRVHNAGPLSGEVLVPGAKNSVLKLMAASVLADGSYEITNVPAIADVGIMADLLRAVGLEVELHDGYVTIVNRGDLTPIAPYELVAQMRASINLLGPLLTRCGYVRISMPGGDDFGDRPIDLHVSALEAMGATFELTADYAKTRKQFDQPIASFQAVGHRAADAFIDLQGIRLTTQQAAWRLAEGLPADPQVALAKYWVAEAGARVVAATQHLHGGMGVDRDYPVHRFYLWAKQLELDLGGSTAQLRRIGKLLAEMPLL